VRDAFVYLVVRGLALRGWAADELCLCIVLSKVLRPLRPFFSTQRFKSVAVARRYELSVSAELGVVAERLLFRIPRRVQIAASTATMTTQIFLPVLDAKNARMTPPIDL